VSRRHPLCAKLWVIALVAGCVSAPARVAPFRLRPDSATVGQLSGPFSGVVVDATTRLPIAGALVYGSWAFESGTGFSTPAARREYVGSTNATGNYSVPASSVPAGARLTEFTLLVYKRGFVAYRSDRRFSDFGLRMDFAQRNNQVAMERWRDDYSHVRHVRFVGGGVAIAALTQWELGDASDELALRDKPAQGPRGSGETLIVSAQLLTEQDIRTITKYDGKFETGPLQDEPDTASYTSQHFKAIEREETWDVALRVWRLPSGKALERYEEVMRQMPAVTEKDDIANRSFLTAEGEIRGVGFVDVQRGVVGVLTCGTSICSNTEQSMAMAKTAYSKIQRLLPLPGATP
jgi:hypothetical protein